MRAISLEDSKIFTLIKDYGENKVKCLVHCEKTYADYTRNKGQKPYYLHVHFDEYNKRHERANAQNHFKRFKDTENRMVLGYNDNACQRTLDISFKWLSYKSLWKNLTAMLASDNKKSETQLQNLLSKNLRRIAQERPKLSIFITLFFVFLDRDIL